MNKNTRLTLEKEREKETKHKGNSYIYTSTVVGFNNLRMKKYSKKKEDEGKQLTLFERRLDLTRNTERQRV